MNQPRVDLSEIQRKNQLSTIQASSVDAFLGEMVQRGLLNETDQEFVITSEHISSISGVKHSYYRLGSLETSIYLVQVETDQGQVTKRLIKE